MTDTRTLSQAREDAWKAFQAIRESLKYAPKGSDRAFFNWTYNAGHIRGSSLNSLEAYNKGYADGKADLADEIENREWNRELYESLNREAQENVRD